MVLMLLHRRDGDMDDAYVYLNSVCCSRPVIGCPFLILFCVTSLLIFFDICYCLAEYKNILPNKKNATVSTE